MVTLIWLGFVALATLATSEWWWLAIILTAVIDVIILANQN